LPLKDVAAAGGWKDVTTLLTCYQHADEAICWGGWRRPTKLVNPSSGRRSRETVAAGVETKGPTHRSGIGPSSCPSWARTRTLLIQSALAQAGVSTTCWETATSEHRCPDSCRSLPTHARRTYGGPDDLIHRRPPTIPQECEEVKRYLRGSVSQRTHEHCRLVPERIPAAHACSGPRRTGVTWPPLHRVTWIGSMR
jgi:hypothetical protein